MTAAAQPLKAPFPYFGGKSRAAALIWERFGDVGNYVEPFAGSLAVLLARPHAPGTETVNDLDGLLSNAWRAIRLDPDAVAYHADQPVVEVDLTARHLALVNARADLAERLMADPDYYDAKLAGWWTWGACCKIGGNWCSGDGPWVNQGGVLVKRGDIGQGVNRKLPHLGDAGQGVNRGLPHLGNAGKGVGKPTLDPENGVQQWMRALSARLKRTRIACGPWDRVVGPSVTTKHGLTAVLLDPPYDASGADNDAYGSEYDSGVSQAAWNWAVENGDNPRLRIAFCAYEDGRKLPPGWTRQAWLAKKGYQSVKADGTHNGHREVIYFNPHCLKPDEGLFGGQL